MKSWALLLVILISQVSFSAVRQSKDLSRTVLANADEILTLPEALRQQHVIGRENELYPQMISIAFSKKQTVEMRWKALTMSAYLKKQDSVADLKKALASSDWFMRNAALLALQSVSPAEGRKAARILINDKALVVRSAAVTVLGPMMDREIRDLFWQEIEANYNYRQKQSLWIREQLLQFLAEEPLPNERSLFESLSKTSSPTMKKLAQSALSKLL